VATAAEADAVAGLEREIFGADAWSQGSVHAELTGESRQAMVAVGGDGHVCGYVVVVTAGDTAEMRRIAVTRGRRRCGVATALLRACDLSRHERVQLEVRADNAAALGFYGRHGFAEVSRRCGYYADGTDAVVMERPDALAERGHEDQVHP
jgi:[ribosomal protein S18]-alanine N-acetyltransferase